jgi:hypothetical protein
MSNVYIAVILAGTSYDIAQQFLWEFGPPDKNQREF